jgi:FlaA1/EpsC-like NDP-sugar epimerase
MNRSDRDDKILVTGATGTIGSEVVKQLASYNNNAIRAAVHSQNKVDKFKQYRTVEIVNFDYSSTDVTISSSSANYQYTKEDIDNFFSSEDGQEDHH